MDNKIKRSTKQGLTVLCILTSFWVSHSVAADSTFKNLQSDTWVATDALGRELGGYAECGSPRPNKYVGIFYWTWHHLDHGGPRDISKIMAESEKTGQPPKWEGPIGASHHWGEPELGYYVANDPYIHRKHASMLSDAGVDVVIFDTTNSPHTFKDQYIALCETYMNMRDTGERTPQIAFLAPFTHSQAVVTKVYDDLYSKGLYKDLWFIWDGKPLIMADPNDFADNKEISEFFTFRKPIGTYFDGPTGPNQWGWSEVYPQHVFYDSDGNAEQIAVSIGQNAVGPDLSMMSHKDGARGRSWHKGKKDTRKDAVHYGFNFSEQWTRALEVDPEFVFITGWNEWVAGRFLEWYKYKAENDSYHPDAMFVDQYNHEYSRDIEPMKGGHTDTYYYQLISYIRQYKGVRKPQKATPAKTIRIDGQFDDWNDVAPEYRDTLGDTAHRDYRGYGETHYTNTTGRNDIISLKVAHDKNNVYFYARTRETMTPSTDANWMLLFIDADRNNKTGWEGYDYLVNHNVTDPKTTTVKQTASGWNWKEAGHIDYRVSKNELELSIPRKTIGMEKLSGPKIEFDFHWADNIQKSNDIIEFAISGDSAPNRRFNYRYMSHCNPKEEKMTKIPDKLVVMTLDDGTRSQAAAGNLLKKYGFGATFFISDLDFHFPGDDKMNWADIRKLHDDGFEIGNHTYSHPDVRTLTKEQLLAELEQLEWLCIDNGIPVPRTFAYPGYHTDGSAAKILEQRGYLFARGGEGRPYDPATDDSHLIPTCGNWGVLENDQFPPPNTMDYFVSTVQSARDGKIVVLTFHGVAGMGDPENSPFKRYLDYLKENDYTVIAMRDLAKYICP